MALDEKKLKEILIKENYLSVDDLAHLEAKEGEFIDTLLQKAIINKELLGQAIGEYYTVPYADLGKEKIDVGILQLVPEAVARAQGVIVFGRVEEGVKVGMPNPDDIRLRQLIEKRIGEPIIPYYITPQDLDEALAFYKPSLQQESESLLKRLNDKTLARDERDDIIVRLVDIVLQYGYHNKASDIHIEPYSGKLMVRLRIDGVMQDILEMPKELSSLILTRIKILAKMRTDEHRGAQDGKLRYYIGGETLDIRVSIVPITEGENIVMRLLSAKSREFDLQSLGLSRKDYEKVKRLVTRPHGMLLVTGPTGSGKTTTLYAVLKILNKRDVHISTIEDPVEYNIEGVSQIQVNPKTNLTFAQGLRAIVRQDPDIIMIGEIRDEETAGIAVNSALTGHLVLSTLHTNDAATTLPRLLDMNIEPFLVASTVNVAIAQRLVRKICEKCRSSYIITDEEKSIIKNDPALAALCKKKRYTLKNLRLYRGDGCKVCGGTGYAGRIGIFEILEMSQRIKEKILQNASSDEIKNTAREEGMITMMEDGMEKVIGGVSTLYEVLRVTRD